MRHPPRPERIERASLPIANCTSQQPYQGRELLPFCGRPGCNDGLDKPSRMGAKLHYRDGSVKEIEK